MTFNFKWLNQFKLILLLLRSQNRRPHEVQSMLSGYLGPVSIWTENLPPYTHSSDVSNHLFINFHSGLFQACSAVSSIAHLEVDVSPSAQDEGDQLQELPFTPVHAPVITLGMNVPRWVCQTWANVLLCWTLPVINRGPLIHVLWDRYSLPSSPKTTLIQ